MSAGLAILVWCALLAALLAGLHAFIVVPVFALGLMLAVKTRSLRLLRAAILAGLVLAAINPLFASYGSDVLFRIGSHPVTREASMRGVLLGARLAATILAVCVLRLVPVREVEAWARRRSPRTALLGMLVARVGSQLRREARAAREHLASQGRAPQPGRAAGMDERLHGARRVWESVFAGAVDRSFAVAAALEVRGFGRRQQLNAPTPGGGVEIANLTVRYLGRAANALDLEAFTVRDGEIVLVVGASGSGKSTLAGVLAGLIPSSTGGEVSGSVVIGGEQVADVPARERQARVGLLMQDPERQLVTTTALDDVAFGLRATLGDADAERRAREELRSFGIEQLAGRSPNTLSGGEMQLVALASLTVLGLDLLVLDEPESQLDVDAAQMLWDAVERVRARGVAVVCIEHRLTSAIEHADRVVALAAGRVHFDADVSAPHERDRVRRQLATQLDVPVRGPLSRHDLTAARLYVESSRIRLALVPGEICALTGPNGSGKTTLLRAMRGLSSANATVLVDGLAIDTIAAHRYVGYLAQSASPILAGTSVGAELDDVLDAAGQPRSLGHAALERAGLAGERAHHPFDLSVGQRERLAIVLALAHAPRVLMLDEPTRGLDPLARHWLASELVAASGRGCAIVVATHDREFVDAIADCELRLDRHGEPTFLHIVRTPAMTVAPMGNMAVHR